MKRLTRVKQLAGFWVLLTLVLMTTPNARAQATWPWATQIPGTGPDDGASISRSAVDAAGNTVLAGSFTGTVAFGSINLVSAGEADVFVARISPTGQWLQAVRGGGPVSDYVNSLALDAAGNITVAGSFEPQNSSIRGFTTTFGSTTLTATGHQDTYVATLNTAGSWSRALRLGNLDYCGITATAYDAAGTLLVTGYFSDSPLTIGGVTLASGVGSNYLFYAELTPAGQWTQVIRAIAVGSYGNNFFPSEVARDSNGNTVIAGGFHGTVQLGSFSLVNTGRRYSADIFVARLSPFGQWIQAVQASSTDDDYLNGMLLTPANEVVIGGGVSGPLGSNAIFGTFTLPCIGHGDAFVARLGANGQWAQAILGGGSESDEIYSLASDAAGNIAVAGAFGVTGVSGSTATASFGTSTLTSLGNEDGFVARLTPATQWGSVLRVGSVGYDEVRAINASPAGGFVISGWYAASPITFGATTLTTPSTSNTLTAYVARLTGFGLATRTATPAERFSVAPNPATTHVQLSWSEATVTARTVQVLDALGREIRRQELPARTASAALDIAGLAPGIYTVRCGAAANRLQVE